MQSLTSITAMLSPWPTELDLIETQYEDDTF